MPATGRNQTVENCGTSDSYSMTGTRAAASTRAPPIAAGRPEPPSRMIALSRVAVRANVATMARRWGGLHRTASRPNAECQAASAGAAIPTAAPEAAAQRSRGSVVAAASPWRRSFDHPQQASAARVPRIEP